MSLENNNTHINDTANSRNESFFNPVYDSFQILLSICVITVNLLVISLFASREYLQTKTNSLLISLAVSDLMVGLLAIPMNVICNAFLIVGVCSSATFIYRFIAVSTMYHIMIVTLERYIYVMYPMKYINIVTVPRLLKVIAGVWIFSLASSLIQLVWDHPSKFWLKRTPLEERYYLGYNIFGIVFCFFLPALIMAISYVRMFLVIHRQIKEIRGLYSNRNAGNPNQRAPIATEARALCIFALMLTVFIVGWLSYYVAGLVYVVLPEVPSKLSDEPFMVLDFIRFAVAFVNPILYAFLKRDFSRALKSLCRRDGVQPGELSSTASVSRFRTLTINFSLSRSSDMYRDA